MKAMHKRPVLPLEVVFVSLLFISSCSPVFYATVGQNVPMFTDKGETSLSAGYANSGSNEEDTEGEGMFVQGAYAVSDSWAIAGSYYHFKNSPVQGFVFTAPSDFKTKGDYAEAGFGKYGQLVTKTIAYEVFTGMGYGSIQNDYQGTYADVKLIKPYVQPSIGYISPYVDLILTPRIGFISYTSHESSDQAGMNAFIDNNNNAFVFEPGATVRAGYRSVKVQLQYSYSTFKGETVYTYNGETIIARPYNEQFISIGLTLLLSQRYK